MGLKTLVLSTFPYFNNAGKEGKLLKQLICTENHKKNSIIALVFWTIISEGSIVTLSSCSNSWWAVANISL